MPGKLTTNEYTKAIFEQTKAVLPRAYRGNYLSELSNTGTATLTDVTNGSTYTLTSDYEVEENKIIFVKYYSGSVFEYKKGSGWKYLEGSGKSNDYKFNISHYDDNWTEGDWYKVGKISNGTYSFFYRENSPVIYKSSYPVYLNFGSTGMVGYSLGGNITNIAFLNSYNSIVPETYICVKAAPNAMIKSLIYEFKTPLAASDLVSSITPVKLSNGEISSLIYIKNICLYTDRDFNINADETAVFPISNDSNHQFYLKYITGTEDKDFSDAIGSINQKPTPYNDYYWNGSYVGSSKENEGKVKLRFHEGCLQEGKVYRFASAKPVREFTVQHGPSVISYLTIPEADEPISNENICSFIYVADSESENPIPYISFVLDRVGDKNISGKEDKINKTNIINQYSTVEQYPNAKVVYTALQTKADDSGVVHKAGTEIITGYKDFQAAVTTRSAVNGDDRLVINGKSIYAHGTNGEKLHLDFLSNGGFQISNGDQIKGIISEASNQSNDVWDSRLIPTKKAVAEYVADKEDVSNKSDVLNISSTNEQYPTSRATYVALTGKANDEEVVHKDNTETITGDKNFTANIKFKNGEGDIDFTRLQKNISDDFTIEHYVNSKMVNEVVMSKGDTSGNDARITFNARKDNAANTMGYISNTSNDDANWTTREIPTKAAVKTYVDSHASTPDLSNCVTLSSSETQHITSQKSFDSSIYFTNPNSTDSDDKTMFLQAIDGSISFKQQTGGVVNESLRITKNGRVEFSDGNSVANQAYVSSTSNSNANWTTKEIPTKNAIDLRIGIDRYTGVYTVNLPSDPGSVYDYTVNETSRQYGTILIKVKSVANLNALQVIYAYGLKGDWMIVDTSECTGVGNSYFHTPVPNTSNAAYHNNQNKIEMSNANGTYYTLFYQHTGTAWALRYKLVSKVTLYNDYIRVNLTDTNGYLPSTVYDLKLQRSANSYASNTTITINRNGNYGWWFVTPEARSGDKLTFKCTGDYVTTNSSDTICHRPTVDKQGDHSSTMKLYDATTDKRYSITWIFNGTTWICDNIEEVCPIALV